MRSTSLAKVVPLPDPVLPWATERRLLFDPSPLEFEQRAEAVGWLHTLGTLKTLALKHLPDLNGLRVLDVGCGPGLLVRELSKAGANITGLDASLDMLEQAANHLRESDQLVQYDLAWPLASCNLKPGEFGLVICSGALQLCPDYRERLSDFAKVLAPQGVLAIAFPCEYSARFEPSCRRIKTPELLSVLTDSGLKVQEQEMVRGYAREAGRPVPYSLIVATAPSRHVHPRRSDDWQRDLRAPPRFRRGEST